MAKRFRPGVSFGDFVVSDVSTTKSRIDQDKEVDYRRGWVVWLFILTTFGGITLRLIYLQLFYGERYRVLSDQNRVKVIKLVAERGKILDRNGKVLAFDSPTQRETKDLSGNKFVLTNWRRTYPYIGVLSHAIGYLGEVEEDEVGLLKDSGGQYDPGDLIGRGGLEYEYESFLRGEDGGRLVEVDNAGMVVRELGKKMPVRGSDLKTGLDVVLAQKAIEAMDKKPGAVVVSQPQTGEILALISSPSFDVNSVNTQFSVLSSQKDMPFFNRAIGAIYPPGSTFKMVTTIAAISEGKVPANFLYKDEGVIRIGDYSYANWLYMKGGGTEGVIGFERALTRSTDTFFYKVGEMTTPEVMAGWAKKMGYGSKTGIDLPGEVGGLVPDPEWKQGYKGEAWFLGNTYHMAIGQGDLLATPLQVNLMTNILASGGKKCALHIARSVYGGGGVNCEDVPIDGKILELIKKGMVGACSTGGTAFPFFDWNDSAMTHGRSSAFAEASADSSLPLVACKTGTAEYMAENGKMKTHGWLTAYAPVDNPEISVTVVFEGGGEGSNVAAPVVRQVMATYFGVTDTYPYSAIPQEMGE